MAGFAGGWRAKAVRYVPRPIGGRPGANLYGAAFNSVHQRDVRMMAGVGVNTIIIEQPTATTSLDDFLDVVQGYGICVIVEFGIGSYWPRAEGDYVEAYENFRVRFYDFLQVRGPCSRDTPRHHLGRPSVYCPPTRSSTRAYVIKP